MAEPTLILFDDGAGRWGPMTDRRATFELRTGAVTTWERIERAIARKAGAIFGPVHLLNVLNERYAGASIAVGKLPGAASAGSNDVLLVNGAWTGLNALAAVGMLASGSVIVQEGGRMIAARVEGRDVLAMAAKLWLPLERHAVSSLPGRVLLERPWHILDQLEAALRADLTAMELPIYVNPAGSGVVTEGGFPIKVAQDARVHPMVVLNAEKGPIVVDSEAIIGSFSVVAGPCYIGRHSVVCPHTHLRADTSLGPNCVVAGEVSTCIFHGQSNKAHTGYLGNSLVGQWVNFGADTNASNLKNTYGTVRTQLEAEGPVEDSGLIKLGPVVGDFVRTAIGSRLMTGSVIGTGSMLSMSRFAPKFVPRFAFATDGGVERTELDKFLDTAQKMMARRGQVLGPAEIERLKVLARG